MKKRGPRIDPCGTPWLTQAEDEFFPSTQTNWRLPEKYDLHQLFIYLFIYLFYLFIYPEASNLAELV